VKPDDNERKTRIHAGHSAISASMFGITAPGYAAELSPDIGLGNMNDAVRKLDKLDVARRQVREAILLFFERRDAVSIHTLASAALQVLSDYAKASGAVSIVKHGRFIREERKKDWFKAINAAQNFFKHADHDPHGQHEFNPELSVFFILDAVLLQGQIEKKLSPACNCFLIWFYLAYPDFLVDGVLKQYSEATLATGTNPQDYGLFLELIHRLEREA
jgi:hypothetical protein